MKKLNIAKKNQKTLQKTRNQIRQMAGKQKLTVGLDLGDRTSRYCILDEAGEVASEGGVPTNRVGMGYLFEKMAASLVVLEVGTHSPWVSHLLKAMGHEVVVANAHRVELISKSVRKNDRADAEKLARLGRADRKLLSPIEHRGEEAQQDLAVLRARAELITARTALINGIRGLMKPMGERLPACDADKVTARMAKELPEAVRAVVEPLMRSVEAISEEIGAYEEQIEEMTKRYPQVELLQQVNGVGELISLAFVLTIEDPKRFAHSRDVGAYVGLQPRQRESGESKPELGISKAGDRMLRSLLVQGAHCILRRGAADSDLRQWGMEKIRQGGKSAKRRAVVGVARKLAVLLHHLWVSGEAYDPLYNLKAKVRAKAAA